MHKGHIRLSFEAAEMITEPQIRAAAKLTGGGKNLVEVFAGTFDLPQGYVTFWQNYESGGRIYGGISPEGEVST